MTKGTNTFIPETLLSIAQANIACVLFSFITTFCMLELTCYSSSFHLIITKMCLGNFEPIELPVFEYSMPDEDYKGSCDYVEPCNLNETWLRKDTLNKVSFPGYTLLSKQRIGKKGGGIGIIIADKLKFRQRDDLLIDTNCFEHLIVELKTRTASLLLVTMYRPPNTNSKEFLHDYKNLADSFNKKIGSDTPIIIGTDHNLDFLKSNIHQVTQNFIEYNLESKLIPVITHPTRITKNSATPIDNIFISQSLIDDYRCGLLLNDMSDHLPC